MLLMLGILTFIVGCVVSAFENNSYRNQRMAERRHKEIMRVFEEQRDIVPKVERRARRRIAKDNEGNLIAEEITEEIER